MLHPHTTLRQVDDIVGVGVFATQRIPRGTITWVLDPLDVLLPDALVRTLDPIQRAVVHRYAWNEGDRWILCWDHGRFVNHSCDPTCLGPDLPFEIAVRDIEAGEQLTDDYRTLGPFEDPFPCTCGSPRCAGWVAPITDAALRGAWRTRFHEAMFDLPHVAQPLRPWVADHHLEAGASRPGRHALGRPAA